jgi:hypothetical protein
METDWFPASKNVQDEEVIKQGVGVCLLGQRWNFACRPPGKGCNHHGRVLFALLDKLKQQLVSKRQSKLLKEISFLHFEVLKHSASSPDLAPSDHYLFPNLRKHLKGRKFSTTEEATLAVDGWFAAQPKKFFLDGLDELEQRSRKCVELRGE